MRRCWCYALFLSAQLKRDLAMSRRLFPNLKMLLTTYAQSNNRDNQKRKLNSLNSKPTKQIWVEDIALLLLRERFEAKLLWRYLREFMRDVEIAVPKRWTVVASVIWGRSSGGCRWFWVALTGSCEVCVEVKSLLVEVRWGIAVVAFGFWRGFAGGLKEIEDGESVGDLWIWRDRLVFVMMGVTDWRWRWMGFLFGDGFRMVGSSMSEADEGEGLWAEDGGFVRVFVMVSEGDEGLMTAGCSWRRWRISFSFSLF